MARRVLETPQTYMRDQEPEYDRRDEDVEHEGNAGIPGRQVSVGSDVAEMNPGSPVEEDRSTDRGGEPERPAEPDTQDSENAKAKRGEPHLELERAAGSPAYVSRNDVGGDDVRKRREDCTEAPLDAEEVQEQHPDDSLSGPQSRRGANQMDARAGQRRAQIEDEDQRSAPLWLAPSVRETGLGWKQLPW